MTLMKHEFEWMDNKYGVTVRPWQIAYEFDNNESSEG
jgi:hypothetical protein